MKPRNLYRFTVGTVAFATGATVLEGVVHDWPMMGAVGAAAVVDGVVFWRSRRVPEHEQRLRKLEAKTPPLSRHDRCMAEIARLERELAADGVLFLMSQAQLDAAVERATKGPCPWCKGQPHAVLEQCPQFLPSLPITGPRVPPSTPAGIYTMEQWLDSLPRPGS